MSENQVKKVSVKKTEHEMLKDHCQFKKGDKIKLTEKGEKYLRKLKKIK